MDATTDELIYKILNDALDHKYGMKYTDCERIVFNMLYNSFGKVIDINNIRDIINRVIGNHINRFLKIRTDYNIKYITDTELISIAIVDLKKCDSKYVLSIIQQGEVDKDTVSRCIDNMQLRSIISFTKHHDKGSIKFINTIDSKQLCNMLLAEYKNIDNLNITYKDINNYIDCIIVNNPNAPLPLFTHEYSKIDDIKVINTAVVKRAYIWFMRDYNRKELMQLLLQNTYLLITGLSANDLHGVFCYIMDYLNNNREYITYDITSRLRILLVYNPLRDIVYKLRHLRLLLDTKDIYASGVYIGIVIGDVDTVKLAINNLIMANKDNISPVNDTPYIMMPNKLLAKCSYPILSLLHKYYQYLSHNYNGCYTNILYKISYLKKHTHCFICRKITTNLFIPSEDVKPNNIIHSCNITICNKCVKNANGICPACKKPFYDKS